MYCNVFCFVFGCICAFVQLSLLLLMVSGCINILGVSSMCNPRPDCPSLPIILSSHFSPTDIFSTHPIA